MPSKSYTPERIIHLLREAEVYQSKGLTIPLAQPCRLVSAWYRTSEKRRFPSKSPI
jgi:hypothetical protein